jgi:hypothetical protein
MATVGEKATRENGKGNKRQNARFFLLFEFLITPKLVAIFLQI